MTLCIAWKKGKEVYFASDSRLTDNNESSVTDVATKIFKIGVKIYDATPSDIQNVTEEILHTTNFGFCFTGSYLNGSLLADTIEEVLSNIQGAAQISDFSINNLSDLAFAIYKQVSKQLMAIAREKGASEVLLGGYCPINNEFQLYKFSPTTKNGSVDFIKEVVSINEKTIFIGDKSAKNKASQLLSKINNQFSHFHLLREIINDNNTRTVGGNIQAGVFRPSNFKTYGIAEYSLIENEYGLLEVNDSYKFRGISLHLNDSELKKGRINIKKSFINPFESERNELFKEVMESIDESLAKRMNKK